ncbi:MAG TPA: hypothetical protein PLN33_20170, partial [Hyphomonadaceae bacterium]|nr:hypothetical protein [Hyphomonadaceae bacterium]
RTLGVTNRMRTRLTSIFLLLVGSNAFAGDLCVHSPSTAARALYESHGSFIFSGASSPPLSEAFAQAVRANLDDQKRTGDSGLIDWNYWTSAQDGEQSRTAKVVSVKATGRQAQVILEYRFYPSPHEKHQAKRSTVKLSRTPDGCWLVEDLQNGKKSVMSYLRPSQ